MVRYLRAALLRGRWRFQLEVRDLSGTLDYEGQNQFGLPIATQTSLSLFDSGVTVAHGFDALPIYVGAEVRFREIDRRIHASSFAQGLHETLRQTTLGPVLGMAWHYSATTSFTIQAAIGKSYHSELLVDFLGTYEPGQLDLPSNTERSLRVELRHAISESFSVVGSLSGRRFSPAKSDIALLYRNGVPAGAYYYPGSAQEQWALGLGIL